jgi:hypothetical protein
MKKWLSGGGAGVVLTLSVATMLSGQTMQQMPRQEQPVAGSEAPLGAAEAKLTALSLASLLEENYWSPEIGRRYAETLRRKASAGEYDAVGVPEKLAQALTRDVQAVAPDPHLRVLETSGANYPGMPQMRSPGSGSSGAAPTLPAIEKEGWLAPGIAYVRFNLFPFDDQVTEAARRFMQQHADAKTIIFDVRLHRGGGLLQMDAMFPYLFQEETVLSTMETRQSVVSQFRAVEDRFSMRTVPGPDGVVRREHYVSPHPKERRLFDAHIFVLTSNRTASAGEAFALALKATGRATLVGEITAGAGNYGSIRPVSERFSAFVPVGVTYDPVTGQRWEGRGIEPHVIVPAEHALTETLVRSGVSKPEAERISARVSPAGPFRRQGQM